LPRLFANVCEPMFDASPPPPPTKCAPDYSFLQASGEPLKLRYVKAPYGPYAENLRHVLQAVNGHLITGYTAAGDAHTDQAIEDAFYAWNPQKAQFTPEQIAIAVARLRAGGWVRDDGPIQAADTR